MSENLDLVRSIYADWERGDFSAAEWAHPEIEFGFIGDGPASGIRSGLAAMGEAWRDFLNAWEDLRVKADDYLEVDDERMLVTTSYQRGRGRTSGVELGGLRTSGAALFHVSNRKVTRLVIYGERRRAFADLGLAPEGDAT